jgi:hypothetical protein
VGTVKSSSMQFQVDWLVWGWKSTNNKGAVPIRSPPHQLVDVLTYCHRLRVAEWPIAVSITNIGLLDCALKKRKESLSSLKNAFGAKLTRALYF